MKKIVLALACVLLGVLRCNLYSQEILSVNEHRIGIREIDNQAEFYDRVSGEKFEPRGFNYIQLVNSPAGFYGESELFHADSHNLEAIDDDFQRMAALGYNSLRVFVDLCRGERCIANQEGLDPTYMDNIVSLLERARQYGIFIMLTANWLPDIGGYGGPAHEFCDESGDFFGGNCLVFSEKGVESYVKFFTDFVQELKTRNAPFDAIWAYELRNEFFVEHDQLPFTKSEGLVTTANGNTYNMSSIEDRRKLGEEGLIYWADTVRSAIKHIDPTSLVTCGFFTPNDPIQLRENDFRIVPFRYALEYSELDFFDIHMYPGFDKVVDNLTNFGVIDYNRKPVVLGEFGTFQVLASDEYSAAYLADQWQTESCEYGVDGFLYWTWDRHRTSSNNPDDPWGGSDQGVFIGKALSPLFKIASCNSVIQETNVALQKNTNASRSEPDFPSDRVVDGLATITPWISGGDAPQWIEVDLGEKYDLKAIELVVETGSPVPVFYTHEVLVKGSSDEDFQKIHTFSGERNEAEVIMYAKENELIEDVRILRVNMTEAPGWVALHEIRAIIPPNRNHLDVPPPPIITFPRPGLEKLEVSNLVLSWKTEVPINSSQIQLAVDSLFENIIEDLTVDNSQYEVGHLDVYNELSWRVRNQNELGWGPWSVTSKITPGTVAISKKDLNAFRVFPNPVEDHLLIESHEAFTGQVEVLDVLGRRIQVLKVNAEHKILINTAGWSPAVYFIHLIPKTRSKVQYQAEMIVKR